MASFIILYKVSVATGNSFIALNGLGRVFRYFSDGLEAAPSICETMLLLVSLSFIYRAGFGLCDRWFYCNGEDWWVGDLKGDGAGSGGLSENSF